MQHSALQSVQRSNPSAPALALTVCAHAPCATAQHACVHHHSRSALPQHLLTAHAYKHTTAHSKLWPRRQSTVSAGTTSAEHSKQLLMTPIRTPVTRCRICCSAATQPHSLSHMLTISCTSSHRTHSRLLPQAAAIALQAHSHTHSLSHMLAILYASSHPLAVPQTC